MVQDDNNIPVIQGNMKRTGKQQGQQVSSSYAIAAFNTVQAYISLYVLKMF